jgi:hypothetical protein
VYSRDLTRAAELWGRGSHYHPHNSLDAHLAALRAHAARPRILLCLIPLLTLLVEELPRLAEEAADDGVATLLVGFIVAHGAAARALSVGGRERSAHACVIASAVNALGALATDECLTLPAVLEAHAPRAMLEGLRAVAAGEGDAMLVMAALRRAAGGSDALRDALDDAGAGEALAEVRHAHPRNAAIERALIAASLLSS